MNVLNVLKFTWLILNTGEVAEPQNKDEHCHHVKIGCFHIVRDDQRNENLNTRFSLSWHEAASWVFRRGGMNQNVIDWFNNLVVIHVIALEQKRKGGKKTRLTCASSWIIEKMNSTKCGKGGPKILFKLELMMQRRWVSTLGIIIINLHFLDNCWNNG